MMKTRIRKMTTMKEKHKKEKRWMGERIEVQYL